jgi:hypothetical protein
MRWFVPLIASLALATPAFAADWDKPHINKGVLSKYTGAPPSVDLTEKDVAKLQSGKPVYKTIEAKTGGRGVAVFYVDATPAKVWKVIGSYPQYTSYIKEVKDIKVYESKGGHDKVWFKVSSWGVGIEYFIDHISNEKELWTTWHLDYSKESDLKDSVGFWKLTPIDGGKRTQVAYSVDLKIRGWVPGFIRTMLVDNGLKTATSWVKKYSEK